MKLLKRKMFYRINKYEIKGDGKVNKDKMYKYINGKGVNILKNLLDSLKIL